MLNINARTARAPRRIPIEGLDWTLASLEVVGAETDVVLPDIALSDAVLSDAVLAKGFMLDKRFPLLIRVEEVEAMAVSLDEDGNDEVETTGEGVLELWTSSSMRWTVSCELPAGVPRGSAIFLIII